MEKEIFEKTYSYLKLNGKTILLVALLLIVSIFGYRWFSDMNKESKVRVKELEKEFKELEKEKAISDNKILEWKEKFKVLDIQDEKLTKELIEIKKDVANAEKSANLSKIELDKLRVKLLETKNRIKEYEKNLPVLDDDLLLEAIKNNTK